MRANLLLPCQRTLVPGWSSPVRLQFPVAGLCFFDAPAPMHLIGIPRGLPGGQALHHALQRRIALRQGVPGLREALPDGLQAETPGRLVEPVVDALVDHLPTAAATEPLADRT